MIGATTMPRPQKPIALPRSSGLNDSSSTACDSGCNAPPVAPWRMRKITSDARFGATPHRNDARVKPTVDTISNRLRPNRPASQPVIGRMIALATRYDVNTHVASSVVADIVLAMCGSDTLTTVVSSTSMNVANMTAIATIHGLTRRCSVIGRSARVNSGRHGHAGAQQVLCILSFIEHDLHRHSLHNLDEIAGGVV